MAEELGEAILRLRTDDSGFGSGVDDAKRKAMDLGGVLDDTSGSAVGLADKLTQAAQSGDRGAQAFLKAGNAIEALASAQAQAKTEITAAKTSYDAGTLSLEAYNKQVLESKSALALFEQEHRQAQAEMRKYLSTSNEVTGSTGQQRQGLMQLTHNLGDVSTMYALGMRPTQIFASQMDQIIQSVQLMVGGTSKLAAFMGGGWGIAIFSAAQILLPLISNLLSADDAAKKAGKSNETLADKLDLAKHSYQEMIAAVREYNAEQRKANQTTLDGAAATAAKAAEDIKAAIAARQKLQAALEEAQQHGAAQYGVDPVTGKPIVVKENALAQQARRDLADNAKQLQDLMALAHDATANVADEISKLDTDPTAKLRAGFDELRKRAKATITDVDALRKRLDEIRDGEKLAVKAQQEATKEAGSGGSSSQASLGDMVALIKQLFPGATITSTTGGKHVAGSDHYSGHAIDFVPAGGMGRYSKAEVEQILKDAGVDIRRNASGVEQFFGPGDPGHSDHFHVAWSGSASPEEAQRRAAQAAEKAKRQADQEARNQEAFGNEQDKLNAQLLQAKQRGLSDADQIAESQRAQVEAERDHEAASIAAAVASGKYTKKQGELLDALNASVTAAKIEQVNREQEAQRLTRSTSLQVGLLDNQAQALQSQERLAKTAEERRALALQLLDIETQQARLKLQETIDLAKLGKATAEQAQIAQDALDKLNSGYAGQRQSVMEQTAPPLDKYVNDLTLSAGQRDEKVQGLIVSELEALNQSIDDAITSRLGVKDPLLKGLINMFVQQVFIRPFAEALQGLSSGGGGGLFGTLVHGIGSLLGGGGSGLTVNAADNAAFAGMFAGGGSIGPGQWGIAGEDGPEPVFGGSSGVSVMSNPNARRAFGGGQAPVIYDLRGAVTTERLLDQMNEISRQHAASAVAAYDSVASDRVKDHLARFG